MIKRIYIAAPYRAETPEGVEINILKAIEVGRWIVKYGEGILFPVIPHVLTNAVFISAISDSYWLNVTLAECLTCDGLIRLSGKSEGADREWCEFIKTDKPVILHLSSNEDIEEQVKRDCGVFLKWFRKIRRNPMSNPIQACDYKQAIDQILAIQETEYNAITIQAVRALARSAQQLADSRPKLLSAEGYSIARGEVIPTPDINEYQQRMMTE